MGRRIVSVSVRRVCSYSKENADLHSLNSSCQNKRFLCQGNAILNTHFVVEMSGY
jgi:hypothetical protein